MTAKETTIRLANLTSHNEALALRAATPPDLLIATPAQLLLYIKSQSNELEKSDTMLAELHTLVVDEADLLLSYGYGEDMADLGSALPRAVHTLLFSATLTADIDSISTLFLHNPAIVDCSDDEVGHSGTMSQYWLRCSHADKFLLMYALLKLNRIPGRSLIFVNTVDRGVRLKLFLEQFGVKSGLLNCELPRESRWHCIQAFNRGVFDILVATDDPTLMTKAASSIGAELDQDQSSSEGGKRTRKNKAKQPITTSVDAEFGVSRGIDFCDVTAVINMDLSRSLDVYKHRIGRTARAGQGGTAISMVDINEPADGVLLERIQNEFKDGIFEFSVDMTKLAAFRYRVDDAMRAVTRHAVKEARLKEIKQELLHSRKLTEHFDANPDDLQAIQHDQPLALAKMQPHLAHVPTYLKPDSENATESVAAVIPSKKLRATSRRRKSLGGHNEKKRKDPLQTFRSKFRKGGR